MFSSSPVLSHPHCPSALQHEAPPAFVPEHTTVSALLVVEDMPSRARREVEKLQCSTIPEARAPQRALHTLSDPHIFDACFLRWRPSAARGLTSCSQRIDAPLPALLAFHAGMEKLASEWGFRASIQVIDERVRDSVKVPRA